MKKVIALTSILALAACSSGISQNDIAKNDANFMGCERVDTSNIHLVYKCSVNSIAWAKPIRKREPNCMFISGGNLNWNAVNADVEYTYVEIIKTKSCEEGFEYRAMVKPFNLETREYFAVSGCMEYEKSL